MLDVNRVYSVIGVISSSNFEKVEVLYPLFLVSSIFFINYSLKAVKLYPLFLVFSITFHPAGVVFHRAPMEIGRYTTSYVL